MPPLQPVTNLTIKSESISCGSSRGSATKTDTDLLTPHQSQNHPSFPQHHQYSQLASSSQVDGNLPDGLVTTMSTSSPSTTTLMHSTNDITNGCSRTIPISWATSASSGSSGSSALSSSSTSSSSLASVAGSGITSSPSVQPSSTSSLLGSTTNSPYFLDGHGITSSEIASASSSGSGGAATPSSAVSSTNLTLLQIKREPCQVSEVTTSNNLGQSHHPTQHQHPHGSNPGHHQRTALTAVVKIESSSSPKSTVMDNHSISVPQSSGNSFSHFRVDLKLIPISLTINYLPAGAIPVGIAVARQRLQEHTTVSHQPKEINRFGIGIADIGK